MKSYLFLVITFFFCLHAFCGILTVSPNGTYPAKYNNVANAITAANEGDSIYIYPGIVDEHITLNKRLVFIGAGINPRTYNKNPTQWGHNYLLQFNAGASGSAFMGIIFSNVQSPAIVNNLLFSDCQFYNLGIELNGNNLLIENCLFSSVNLRLRLFGAQNNVVRNCIFSGDNTYGGGINLEGGSNTRVLNNVFCSNSLNSQAIGRITNYIAIGSAVLIANNIFFRTNHSATSNSELTYTNNIYYLSTDDIPGDPALTKNVRANPNFVNYPNEGAVFNFTHNLNLKPDSPAKNWGTDGKDAGVWGGAAPINTGFEAPIPRIYNLEVNNAIVPPGGTIQLKIQATKAQ